MVVWIVDIDLEKFFDNVPQDKLMSYVGRVIHGGNTESMIRKYLKAGVMNQGRYEPTDVGTPQGGNLSPLLSNITLNELDYELDKGSLKKVSQYGKIKHHRRRRCYDGDKTIREHAHYVP